MREIAKPVWPHHRPAGTETVTALVILPPTQSNQLFASSCPECHVQLEQVQCLKCFSQHFVPHNTKTNGGDNWTSFSFAVKDSLSPWHHLELAFLLLSLSLLFPPFMAKLLSLMNSVVTETVKLTHTTSPAYSFWQLTDCRRSLLRHIGCHCSSQSNWTLFGPADKSEITGRLQWRLLNH